MSDKQIDWYMVDKLIGVEIKGYEAMTPEQSAERAAGLPDDLRSPDDPPDEKRYIFYRANGDYRPSSNHTIAYWLMMDILKLPYTYFNIAFTSSGWIAFFTNTLDLPDMSITVNKNKEERLSYEGAICIAALKYHKIEIPYIETKEVEE